MLMIIKAFFKENDNFFDLRKVLKSHFSLFKNSQYQYIVFYVLPCIFSVGLALIYIADNVFYSELAVVISIIFSMLMASMSILIGKDCDIFEDRTQREQIKIVIRETINAILFVSLLCILLLLMVLVSGIKIATSVSVNFLFAAITYYLFIVLLLNLLLIIKRMARITEFNLIAEKKQRHDGRRE